MKELELYKMFVAEPLEDKQVSIADSIQYGFITSKPVSAENLLEISQYYSRHKLDSSSLKRTLFTKNELTDISLMNKVYKQILHYISGGNFGLQEVEFEGRKFTFDIVQIVSKEELFEVIKNDLYISRPLSEEKLNGIYNICGKYEFELDYSKIKNNEFKCLLLVNANYKFTSVSGDDIMRAIIKTVTGSSLLIKSKAVIDALTVSSYDEKISTLLNRYSLELSQVFNRHKRLILALKTKKNAEIINRISKMSKVNHIPIKPSLNKVFINKYLKMKEENIISNLKIDLPKLTIVDKMKLINHSDVLLSDMPNRVFTIRNGKAYIKEENYKTSELRITCIKNMLVTSLAQDLSFLKGKNIKYPTNMDYGFPISEKKSTGNIPFGTVISATGIAKYLVAGMYWRNNWGSHDLDLSSVSLDGSRTGWGQVSTYAQGVLFSGDITNAPNGAIEYLANTKENPVVLINNIFNGNLGTKFKIVIGENDSVENSRNNKYVQNVLAEIECRFDGNCRNMVLGALYQDKFILYPLSLGSKIVSGKKDKAILPYMLVEYTRLKEILLLAGANLVDETEEDINIDLSIENITFDKLSNLLTDDIDKKVVV